MRLILILLIFMATTANAQDLSAHQWKDRVLLIFTNDTSNVDYNRQISELKEKTVGLQERKLVVYQITPGKIKKGLSENMNWKKNIHFYNRHKSTSSPLEIILIGLDGGKKLLETNFISTEKIFTVIDGMPMRKAELRNNGNF